MAICIAGLERPEEDSTRFPDFMQVGKDLGLQEAAVLLGQKPRALGVGYVGVTAS